MKINSLEITNQYLTGKRILLPAETKIQRKLDGDIKVKTLTKQVYVRIDRVRQHGVFKAIDFKLDGVDVSMPFTDDFKFDIL